MYLMIENPGIAPITAFTRLGCSGARYSDCDGTIGQFGSGNKHGINIMLRAGIPFKVCTDGTTLDFYFETDYVTDADGTVRESYPVKCKCKGKTNRIIDCAWTTEFGELDWTEISMALREFVSNAIDWAKIVGDELPTVTVVDKIRNKSGTTRVFIDYDNEEVRKFHRDLGKNFLHFSGNPDALNQTFLKKNPESSGPTIFREGVKIRELSSRSQAVFDYNLKASQIDIDESRNSSEYALRGTIGQIINEATPEILTQFFKKLSEGDVYESGLDDYYLGYCDSDEVKENWVQGWKDFAGESVIASEMMGRSPIAEHVKAKGHNVQVVKSDAFVKVAQDMGVDNVATVLGKAGAAGRIDCEITEEAQKAVDQVWGWCEVVGMTGGKSKPGVKCFKQLMDGEGECLGFYTPGSSEVSIREDLGGKIALKTAIEEVAHYITGSTDCSRDFQNFAFDMIVELCV